MVHVGYAMEMYSWTSRQQISMSVYGQTGGKGFSLSRALEHGKSHEWQYLSEYHSRSSKLQLKIEIQTKDGIILDIVIFSFAYLQPNS